MFMFEYVESPKNRMFLKRYKDFGLDCSQKNSLEYKKLNNQA